MKKPVFLSSLCGLFLVFGMTPGAIQAVSAKKIKKILSASAKMIAGTIAMAEASMIAHGIQRPFDPTSIDTGVCVGIIGGSIWLIKSGYAQRPDPESAKKELFKHATTIWGITKIITAVVACGAVARIITGRKPTSYALEVALAASLGINFLALFLAGFDDVIAGRDMKEDKAVDPLLEKEEAPA